MPSELPALVLHRPALTRLTDESLQLGIGQSRPGVGSKPAARQAAVTAFTSGGFSSCVAIRRGSPARSAAATSGSAARG
ncbi:hypothetical protein ACF087_33845 [Streptomyces goshikiensis]|uniref:hypothetical protein n=1 Tax=Streptomyces goshikiensis TaxID=1942 RepID=UPI0036FB3DBE